MIDSRHLKTISKILGSLLFIVLFFVVSDVASEEELIGSDEYRNSCLPCHGVGGKGNGPMAELLKVQPSDLTVIAKNNEGIFPLHQVHRMIDGRQGVTGHGDRDMPIWGARYLKEDAERYGPFGGDDVVRLRILELVYYLQSIQAK